MEKIIASIGFGLTSFGMIGQIMAGVGVQACIIGLIMMAFGYVFMKE